MQVTSITERLFSSQTQTQWLHRWERAQLASGRPLTMNERAHLQRAHQTHAEEQRQCFSALAGLSAANDAVAGPIQPTAA